MDFKRILVKLSGERFAGASGNSGSLAILDREQIGVLAQELVDLQATGREVAVVLGGGNILRGKEAAENGIEEAQAHHMGMLATVINALALQSVLEQKGCDTRVMSALEIPKVAEPLIRRRAVRHIDKGRIVIFAAGTGNPFVTTDTAGALRAIEIDADLLLKASKVDGIYTADPETNPEAQHIAETTYKNILVEDLQVMDGSAIALCREHKLPLMVCAVTGEKSMIAALDGKNKRTLVMAK